MIRFLLLCLLVGLAAATAALAAEPPSAADLEAELVCPVCETTLDQSNAPIAERMKVIIRERIAAGDSEQEIKDALVAQFGPAVIARPPEGGFGLLAWLFPIAIALSAAIVVAFLVRAWSQSRGTAAQEQPLDDELERRVDEELARFDG